MSACSIEAERHRGTGARLRPFAATTPGLALGVALALVLVAATAATARAQSLTAAPLEARLSAVAEACREGDGGALAFASADLEGSVRHLAVSCLPLGDPGSVELLVERAGDPDATVRAAVARRLAEVAGRPEARRALAALSGDGDVRVREAAWASAPLPEGATALSALFVEADARVAEVLAARLDEAHAAGDAEGSDAVTEGWSPEAAERYRAALRRRRARAQAPELAALVDHTRAELDAQGRTLGAAAGDDTCAPVALARLAELDAAASEALGADSGAIELVMDVRAEARETVAAYAACRSAVPLGEGGGVLDAVDWVATPRLRTDWLGDFGLLRADAAGLSAGGELRASAESSLLAYLPHRWDREAYPERFALALGGRLGYEHYYRSDDLTGVYGGGLLATNVPFECAGAACGVGLRLYGRHEAGRDEADFPARLVAVHDRLGAEGHWLADAESSNYRVRAGYERLRYAQASLAPAGMDRIYGRVEADTRFQLRLAAARTSYARAGAAANAPTIAGREDRDSTVLSALSGVRFGSPGDGSRGALRFEVLAGAALPLMDIDAFGLDPEVIFDLSLLLRALDTAELELELELAGSRRIEASPRNFALQAIVEALLRLTVRAGRGDTTDVLWELVAFYDLADHRGNLTEDTALRINSVGGEMVLELVFSEWFGLGLRDRLEAVGESGSDLELSNLFSLSVFVPLGGPGLDPEVAWP